MENDYSDRLPESYPEKKDVTASSQERIKRAMEMFEENFNEDGKPTTKHGYILNRRHSSPVSFSIRKLQRVQQKSNRK